MSKSVVKTTSNDQSSAINKQAERSAQSDKKMFEAAIELINERGTAYHFTFSYLLLFF